MTFSQKALRVGLQNALLDANPTSANHLLVSCDVLIDTLCRTAISSNAVYFLETMGISPIETMSLPDKEILERIIQKIVGMVVKSPARTRPEAKADEILESFAPLFLAKIISETRERQEEGTPTTPMTDYCTGISMQVAQVLTGTVVVYCPGLSDEVKASLYEEAATMVGEAMGNVLQRANGIMDMYIDDHPRRPEARS